MAQIAKSLSFKVFESKFYAGESINTIKASMKNIVDASTVCKWYRAACECINKHRASVKKQIIVTRDKIDGIFNIVDNKHGLKFAHLNAVFNLWALESAVVASCLKYNFQLVIL